MLCLRFRYVTACTALAILFAIAGYATSAHMGLI